MTSLMQMTGLPVVFEGRRIGLVEKGLLTENGRELSGVVMRSGMGVARWLPEAAIESLGEVSVVARREGKRVPKQAGFTLSHVLDTSGLCLGLVEDVLLHPATRRVLALEVLQNPLHALSSRRRYVTHFTVTRAGESVLDATAGGGAHRALDAWNDGEG